MGKFTMQCEIARQFFEMLGAITAEQKIPREYCGGHVLHRAELELLEKIDEYPAANGSALSAKSGVTKSAVTQICARLMEKGLIERFQSPANKKERYYRLTEAGKRAREAYAEGSRAASEQLQSYLCSLGEGDKRAIVTFISMMKRYAPVCSFPCRREAEEKACFLAEQKKGMEKSCWN